MALVTIGLIVVVVWIAVLIVVFALCTAAARSDAGSDRIHAALL